MPASDGILDPTAVRSLPRLAFRTLPVLLLAAVFHLILIAALTWTQMGGSPVIRRLLPLATPGQESFALPPFQDALSATQSDVLVIGPSAAFVSLSSRRFEAHGLRVITLGSNSQTPLNSHALLTSYLPLLKPKVVLFAVSQHALSLDGLESHAELVSNLSPRREFLSMTWHQGTTTAWNLALAALLRHLRTPVSSFSQTTLEVETYLPGGFVATDLPFRLHPLPAQITLSPLPRQERWLQRCFAYVRSQNAVPVAVCLPIHSELENRITYFDEGQFHLGSLVAQSYVPFLDLKRSSSGIADGDFYDVYHLRPSGADKASQAVASWLLSLELFPQPTARTSP